MNMNRNDNQLESEVQDALNAMLVCYQSADVLVDRMLKRYDQGESITSEMKLLEDAKKEIVFVESTTKSILDRYRAENRRSSEVVKKLRTDASDVLRKTIDNIHILENRTREAQQKLLPGLGATARANQMKNAYGSS